LGQEILSPPPAEGLFGIQHMYRSDMIYNLLHRDSAWNGLLNQKLIRTDWL
jgi:hypothetical protein